MESNDIFIRDYYLKKLGADQTAKFEELYQSDSSFKKEADQVNAELLGIRAASREQLKGKFTQWEEQNSNSIEKRSGFYKIMGIGASIVLLIGAVFYLIQPPSDQELYLSYYEPYPNYEHTVARGESNDEPSLTDQAFAMYDEENFNNANELFTELLKTKVGNTAAVFFRAMSRVETDRLGEALTDFEHVITQQEADYSEAAKWYSALIYLKQNDRKKSLFILNEIAEKNGNYQVQAKELLEEL